MLPRDRVFAALNCEPEKLDRIPMADAFFADTLERWKQEGMPADVLPQDYFGFDMDLLFADVSLRLPEKTIEETDEYLVAKDKHGFAAKRFKKKAGIHYLDHAIKTRADWDAARGRLAVDCGDTARVGTVSYFEPFVRYPTWSEMRDAFAKMRQESRFVSLNCYGPYEHCWRMCGYTESLMMLVSDPEWSEDIFAVHTDLVIHLIRRALDEGIRMDGLFLVEDLGVQTGPLFSPSLLESLLVPQYARLAAFLQAEGIYFLMHSCGAIGPLIPILIEAGVQVLQPLQATAGLDVRKLKEEFGDRLTFMGNINAKIMSDPEAIEEEIRGKIPGAVQGGGYIYSSDHSVPSDVSLEDYERILSLVREVGARDCGVSELPPAAPSTKDRSAGSRA